ncbi:conserved hypothetical protein [Methylorubrum extorquens CM4]|uniref:Uncharacterized protein n=1 Tax=Methylorubrum extorquens (strain CM4 / NCIMB 13688) TaxID=440085 RepID=B7KRK6_METC4|nr:hypothetical protein [Methylorubrum extorquens]ACK85533.1 conserved hypothetical protein [Methylorubrum extorquens CM4]
MPRKQRPADLLPRSLPPIGLSRVESAAYIGVSTSLFDTMVKDGRMPLPKRINARTVWSRSALAAAFGELPDEDSGVCGPRDGGPRDDGWGDLGV